MTGLYQKQVISDLCGDADQEPYLTAFMILITHNLDCPLLFTLTIEICISPDFSTHGLNENIRGLLTSLALTSTRRSCRLLAPLEAPSPSLKHELDYLSYLLMRALFSSTVVTFNCFAIDSWKFSVIAYRVGHVEDVFSMH